MQLELNGRTYLILAALIAAGLFMEALKFWPSSQSLGGGNDILQISQPYSVSEKTIRQTTKQLQALPRGVMPMPAHLPQLDLKDQITKWQSEQEKLKAEEEKKKAEAKNWHWVWNKEQQKWEWKKKTKKKKADAKKTDPVVAEAQPDTSANNNPTPSTNKQPFAVTGPTTFAPDATGSQVGFGSPSGGGRSAQKFLSAQEWISYLESSPSQSKTDNFVSEYKQHLVTDATYYQVIGSMLKSSNIQVQQQGIYALGKTPSLESFQTLANEQNSLQTSSPLYSATNTDLQGYQSMSNLGILQQAIGSGQSQGVQQVALSELQGSINSNLGSSSPTGQPSTLSGNATKYQAFVTPLTQIANGGGSSSGLAQQILGTLSNYGIH